MSRPEARGRGSLAAGAALCVLLVGTVHADQDPPPPSSTPVDIRGIWKDKGLDKKGGAARGLVASEIQLPRKTKHVAPDYPAVAKEARVQGQVLVECVIDTAGVPTDCKVTRGPGALETAALDAVREWRFEPLSVRGVPAPALAEFTVTFRLVH